MPGLQLQSYCLPLAQSMYGLLCRFFHDILHPSMVQALTSTFSLSGQHR